HLSATALKNEKGIYWPFKDEVYLGLAHGASGISLFFLYLYLATRDEQYLDLGKKTLDFDLNNGEENLDGGISWREYLAGPPILYPYWRYGSAGVGSAVLRYWKLLGENRYQELLEKIYVDTDRKYAVFPGYFTGLAGLGDFLLDLHLFTQQDRYLESAYKVASGLLLSKIEKPNGSAFPGNGLARISCDYGTGSAGVGLFFHRLHTHDVGSFMLDELFIEIERIQYLA
ncbi:MAG: lanthionine synthetase C family protein, partial [Acidobacteriota bacterium]